MTFDKVTTASTGHLHVRMRQNGGGFHRYALAPGDDLTGQPAEVVAAAEAAWTPEVIAAYQESLEQHETP